MEEKVLLPAAQRLRGGEPLPVAARLRRDHGLFAAMLVPTPTPDLLRRFGALLAEHNALEEGPGGAYDLCDVLAANEIAALVAALEAVPEVKVKPHFNGPAAHKLIEDMLRARGD